ncbi:MAG: thioredoxin domain-containing protein, partial [bacterium]|nr:thioredoxin domain-containing protein [bacterium]
MNRSFPTAWIKLSVALLSLFCLSCAMEPHNRLGKEKSPYLLQHKDNPVHWFPWGPAAFETAKKENKLIFLSIGYSTCHWCHVMEEDSFERKEVADVLNRDFISIKVDREERPDVDRIYMDAVVAMTGQGGWPLSVFLTPDLKPFFGATFVPRANFIQLLKNIQNVWETQREKILESSEQLMTHLQGAPQNIPSEPIPPPQNFPPLSAKGRINPSAEKRGGRGDFLPILEESLHSFEDTFDSSFGGFGRAPKFPKSVDCSLLLRLHQRFKDVGAIHESPLQMVTLTLDKMARGGIYDHLGGGFARYSTDNRWLVPHFEKMLYDNALLTWTYLEAFQVTGNERFASVARETLDYVLRDMTHPEGGFYSAEDADSQREEGKFYVWNEAELKSLLIPEEFDLFKKVYQVTPEGNFVEHGKPNHHTTILSLSEGYDWKIKEDPLLKSAHQKLFAARKKRIHPHKDDKVLTEWNGLMIAAMAKGYQVLGDEKYLQASQHAAEFIKKNLSPSGGLLRRFRDNHAAIPAFASDYAFLIHGLIELYQSDFNPDWLQWAKELQETQDKLFWDSKDGGYFFSEESAQDLIVRTKETHDGATPSGNSVSLLNLLRLNAFGFNFSEKIDELLNF